MEQGFARSSTMSKRRTQDENGERGDLGSRRWTERQGQQVVAAWRRSGLAASEFARRQGINQQRLSWWCKRLRKSNASKDTDSRRAPIISLVPAEVRVHTPVSAALSLAVMRLPCGISIEFSDAGAMSAEWVASLVSALSRGS
jgi:transposase-like protein